MSDPILELREDPAGRVFLEFCGAMNAWEESLFRAEEAAESGGGDVMQEMLFAKQTLRPIEAAFLHPETEYRRTIQGMHWGWPWEYDWAKKPILKVQLVHHSDFETLIQLEIGDQTRRLTRRMKVYMALCAGKWKIVKRVVQVVGFKTWETLAP